MNPLNIPTDNLYKFLAVVGLIICFIGLVFLGTLQYFVKKLEYEVDAYKNEFNIYKNDIDLNSEKLSLFYEKFNYQLDQSDKKLNALASEINEGLDLVKNLRKRNNPKNDFRINQLSSEISIKIQLFERELNNLHSTHKENYFDLKNKSIDFSKTTSERPTNLVEIENQISNTKFLIDNLISFRNFILILEFIGLLLTITGFKLWYQKVQRYLDIDLEIKSRSYRPKINNIRRKS